MWRWFGVAGSGTAAISGLSWLLAPAILPLFYGIVVVLLLSHLPSVGTRIAFLIAAVSLVLFVAVSRIFLSVRFMTDCVAAVIEAVVWLGLCGVRAPRRPTFVSTAGDEA